jgi:hypothetical protein
MRANEFLTEGGLDKKDFYKPERIVAFINKAAAGGSFVTTDNKKVILKKDRALISAIAAMRPYAKNWEKDDKGRYLKEPIVNKQNLPPFPLQFVNVDTGEKVLLSKLQKTVEFGSSEKEGLKVKPSDLSSLTGKGPGTPDDITDPTIVRDVIASKSFVANELAGRIMGDPALTKKGGRLGKIIVSVAGEISKGNAAVVPTKQMTKSELDAFRDYACEYLGILQFINGQSTFENADAFYKHLGTNDLSSLMLYFPKKSSTALADSLIIENRETGNSLLLSSKGGKMGAPPSLDSLKIKDEMRTKNSRSQKAVIKFMDVARDSKARTQPFDVLNYLFSINPALITQKHGNLAALLPFTGQDILDFTNANDAPKLSRKTKILLKLNTLEQKGGIYGKIHAFITSVIIELVNTHQILPNLNSTVLEILGDNFLQIYSDVKGGKLTTNIKWPNKVDGTIKLYTKAYAGDPGKGKLSWYLS